MHWNDHSKDIPSGVHAFLSPSGHSWLRYSKERLLEVYEAQRAKIRGTELHDIAQRLIKQKIKLPSSHKTLNMYVNDAIGFKLIPEQPLKYSNYCFGTVDAIGIVKKVLHIHDLKTGKTPASFDQLKIYAALFFLEYSSEYMPGDLNVEMRIYQNDEVFIEYLELDDLVHIMDTIITFDKILKERGAEDSL